MIERHIETTWRVRNEEGIIVQEESPFEAAVLDLYTWLLQDNRIASRSAVGVSRYILSKGTAELVAKVEELREWLRSEEEQIRGQELPRVGGGL